MLLGWVLVIPVAVDALTSYVESFVATEKEAVGLIVLGLTMFLSVYE